MVQLTQLSKLLIGVVIIATLFFFAGRCTAPGESTVHEKKIDSLNKAVLAAQILQLVHKQKSEVLQTVLAIEQNQKRQYQEKYSHILVQLRKINKDSAIKTFARMPADTSRLTDSLAFAIVKEQAALTHCTTMRSLDSVEMVSLSNSYMQLDSAYQKSEIVITTNNGIIAEQKKLIKIAKRKPHWWEFPLIAFAFIAGVITTK